MFGDEVIWFSSWEVCKVALQWLCCYQKDTVTIIFQISSCSYRHESRLWTAASFAAGLGTLPSRGQCWESVVLSFFSGVVYGTTSMPADLRYMRGSAAHVLRMSNYSSSRKFSDVARTFNKSFSSFLRSWITGAVFLVFFWLHIFFWKIAFGGLHDIFHFRFLRFDDLYHFHGTSQVCRYERSDRLAFQGRSRLEGRDGEIVQRWIRRCDWVFRSTCSHFGIRGAEKFESQEKYWLEVTYHIRVQWRVLSAQPMVWLRGPSCFSLEVSLPMLAAVRFVIAIAVRKVGCSGFLVGVIAIGTCGRIFYLSASFLPLLRGHFGSSVLGEGKG